MRRLAILLSITSLTGCATAMDGTACTNIISGKGGLLQFCQTNQRIEVTETGIADKDHGVKIVDDPSTLTALASHLTLHHDKRVSRRLVAHACVIEGANYVSVKATDLDRILQTARSGYRSLRDF